MFELTGKIHGINEVNHFGTRGVDITIRIVPAQEKVNVQPDIERAIRKLRFDNVTIKQEESQEKV